MRTSFKNLKIRTRMLVGFLIMTVLVGAVGGVGIYGLRTAADDGETINQLGNNGLLVEQLNKNLSEQRAVYRDGALMQSNGLHDAALEDLKQLESLHQEFLDKLELLTASLITEEGRRLVGDIETAYGEFSSTRTYLETAIEENASQQEILNRISDMVAPLAVATSAMDTTTAFVTEQTDLRAADNTAQANKLTVLLVGALAFSVAISILLGLGLSHSIANPIRKLVEVADQLSKGNTDVNIRVESKDEIGQLTKAFLRMSQAIHNQAELLAVIADGDYTKSAQVRSESDVMNQAINNLLERNNQMLADIRTAAEQVATGARQISQGAQDLSSGSNEQASAIEEFTATLSELKGKSEENAQISNDVLVQVQKSGQLMQESTLAMEEMTRAMQDINGKSKNISKVIKAIDDIAFQTNILALNAAVEAARAGQHGKGFAVVADEVRNLASKSAEAAKETAELIEQSLLSVQTGNEIVQKTNESLMAVGAISEQNASSIALINEASRQQSLSMNEITAGIGQISDVVQANSSTAEQAAASAEEMTAQADLLSEIVSRFQLEAGMSQNTSVLYSPRLTSDSAPDPFDINDFALSV